MGDGGSGSRKCARVPLRSPPSAYPPVFPPSAFTLLPARCLPRVRIWRLPRSPPRKMSSRDGQCSSRPWPRGLGKGKAIGGRERRGEVGCHPPVQTLSVVRLLSSPGPMLLLSPPFVSPIRRRRPLRFSAVHTHTHTHTHYTHPSLLHEEHGVDAPVQLRVVGHLSIFSPHHLPRRRHHPQLADIDLDHRPLGDDTQ